MKCPNCKRNIPDGSKFCNHCGQRIENNSGAIECPKCNREIPSDSQFCPFCGNPLLTEKSNNRGVPFPLYDILLGSTTIEDVANRHNLWGSVRQEEDGDTWIVALIPGIVASAFSLDAPITFIGSDNWQQNIEIWRHFVPLCPNMSLNDIELQCMRTQLDYKFVGDDEAKAILILYSNLMGMQITKDYGIVVIPPITCPHCGETDYQLEDQDSTFNCQVLCRNCKNVYDVLDEIDKVNEGKICCPHCGKTDCTDDGSYNYPFKCNSCGHIWGIND